MIAIKVWGPNLPAAQQRQGDLHVHTATCADNRRYRGEDGWKVNVESLHDIVEACYPASEFGYDPEDWQDYANDIYVAPCVKLPVDL